VLYQSSQDVGLYYKDFIEDVVLGLERQGARLIPPFHLFRAHHNKVFMEILRDLTPVPQVRSLRSKGYGTYEEFARDLEADRVPLPAVIKPASGDSGRGVALVHTPSQARRAVRDLTLVLDRDTAWKNVYRTVFTQGWQLDSFRRRKFIVQEYVPGLDHDWKTIAFGPKYFVTVRPTRPGDFRASGSRGERTYPTSLPDGLLDFLEAAFTAFRAPYASIDVMYDGRRFYLGEIQFVRFGTGAVIRCPHHWRRQDGRWRRIEGRREWEPELAECLAHYIEQDLDA
jgi:glutathione synthase/RimK-type ligase-like ATP-grasp enzyme